MTDADVKPLRQQGTSVNFKRILTDREEQADEAYQALKNG